MSRARVKIPVSGGILGVDVLENGVSIIDPANALDFTGAVNVTDNGGDEAGVEILPNFTENNSGSQNTSSITAKGSATDINAAITPKGNGANTAQTPDGTSTGGNARGHYATDWQKRRNNANEVASGNDSVVSGGRNNKATATDSTVSGGRDNTASGTDGVVLGGRSNTASGNDSTSSGRSNVSSGTESFCTNSFNVSAGIRSTALNGSNRVNGTHSIAKGAGGLGENDYSEIYSASYRESGASGIVPSSGRSQLGNSIVGYNSKVQGQGNPSVPISSGAIFYLSPTGDGVNGTTLRSSWISAKDNQHFTLHIKLLATITGITGTATGVNIGDLKQWNFEASGKIVAGTRTILNASTTPVIIYEDTGISTMSASFILGPVSPARSFTIEVTNATFLGGGSLEMSVVGFIYWQETTIDI